MIPSYYKELPYIGNLCAEKWQLDNFDKKSIANPLLRCLEANGMDIQNVGLTYQADHVSSNGTWASSALDHVYSSQTIRNLVQVKKLNNSATDHLPVIVNYKLDLSKVKYSSIDLLLKLIFTCIIK